VVEVREAGRRHRQLPTAAYRRRPVRKAHVEPEDGTEVEGGLGSAYVIEPGHDAWVVGDESFVAFEFEAPSAEE
jgi:hypothetical protein